MPIDESQAAGIAVVATGHCHPDVVAAIRAYQHAARLRSLQCIQHQVLQDSLHLDRIAIDLQVGRSFAFQEQIAVGSQRTRGLAKFLDEPRGIESLHVALLVTRLETRMVQQIRQQLAQCSGSDGQSMRDLCPLRIGEILPRQDRGCIHDHVGTAPQIMSGPAPAFCPLDLDPVQSVQRSFEIVETARSLTLL